MNAVNLLGLVLLLDLIHVFSLSHFVFRVNHHYMFVHYCLLLYQGLILSIYIMRYFLPEYHHHYLQNKLIYPYQTIQI